MILQFINIASIYIALLLTAQMIGHLEDPYYRVNIKAEVCRGRPPPTTSCIAVPCLTLKTQLIHKFILTNSKEKPMTTIVIRDVLKADVNSLQSSDAKDFKASLEQTVVELGGKLSDFKVTKGVVSIMVDTDDVADRLLEELKLQEMDAVKERPLKAFKDRYTLKQTAEAK
jgi:hypothetical protein